MPVTMPSMGAPLSDQTLGYMNSINSANVLLGQEDQLRATSRSLLEGVAMSLPGTLLASADTFLESFGILEKNDMENYLRKEMPDFGNFFVEHRKGLGAAGDLVGAFLPGMVAMKAVRQGSWLAQGATKLFGEGATKLFSTGAPNAAIFENTFQKLRSVVQTTGVANIEQIPGFTLARKTGIMRSIADTVIEGVAADALIAGTMHSSDFLFPEEMSTVDNIVFAGATNLLFGAAGGLIARRDFVRGVNAVLDEPLSRAAKDAGLRMTDVVSNIPGMRGPAIGMHAELLWRQQAAAKAAFAQADDASRSAMAANITATEESLKNLTLKAFQDSPIPGVTHSVNIKNVDAPEIKTVLNAYKQDPKIGYNMLSYEMWDEELVNSLPVRLKDYVESVSATAKADSSEFKLMNDETTRLVDNGKSLTVKQEDRLTRLRNKVAQSQSRAEDAMRTVGVAVEVDGTTRGLTGRGRMFQDGTREFRLKGDNETIAKADGKNLTSFASGEVHVHDPDSIDFEVLPTGQFKAVGGVSQRIDNESFQQLTHYQQTAVWDTLQKSLERINPDTQFEKVLKPLANISKRDVDSMHFTQLDYKLALAKQHYVQFSNFRNVDELEFASFGKKFDQFQTIWQEVGAAQRAGREHEFSGRAGLENLARSLNLPTDNHATIRFMQSQTLPDQPVKLTDVVNNMDELRSALKKIDEFEGPEQPNHMLSGNMLNLARDRKPVIAMMKNNDNRAGINVEDLMAAMTATRAWQMTKLRQSESPTVVGMMQFIEDNMPAILQAKKELTTLVHGNEIEGSISKYLVQQSHRFRESPAFKPFDFITEMMDKLVDNHMERLLNPEKFGIENAMPHQQHFNALLSRGAEADLDSFMTARHSLGAGWVVNADEPLHAFATQTGETMYQIRLADHGTNKRIFETMFPGQSWKEYVGDGSTPLLMPYTNRAGSTVTMTEKAANAVRSFSAIGDETLAGVNSVRAAKGLAPIERRALHIPAPDFANKKVMYLVDSSGKVRNLVSGVTDAQVLERAQKEVTLSGGKLSIISQDTMERYHSARSEAFFELSDFSKTKNQTGPRTGKAFGDTVTRGEQAFKEILESSLKQYSDIGREIRMTIFDPEIQYLKRQRAASGIKGRTIYDELTSRIAGVQNLDADSSVGRVLLTAESVYDRLVQGAYDRLAEVFPRAGRQAVTAEKNFQKIEKRFAPEHSPYTSVQNYLDKAVESTRPVDLKRHAAALNEITTALTLRMGDVGMAAINVLSLGATLPPVVTMLKQQAGETAEQWASRIGAFGVLTPKNHAYFSPAKAITTAIHFMFTEEGKEIAKRAASLGYFDQFAAEQVEIFARTGEQFLPGLLRHASNKLSILTDKSERLARSMSWMTFYKIGKDGLGLEEKAAMAFAHRQANNVIADFRPSNRPAIFQGAAGMPLGLFTTFMWNYLQRVVGMVESKSVRAGALQVGLQASLFGSESLPGWEQFTNIFMDNYDGSFNVVDRLNEVMGHTGADVFLNGTVGNLPRLFGAEDGISIAPRASVGLPFQSGFSLDSIAGVRLLARAGQTFGKVVDSAIENEGLAAEQVGEILATANINKLLSNTIEIGLGHALDHNMSLIEENTRTGIGVASRALGFKPLMTDEMRQENVRNRATERIQSELKARLGDALQSAVRNGKLDDDTIESALDSYLKAGGNAGNFRTYLQSQVLAATQTQSSQEIVKALKRSYDDNRLARLLYLERD